MKPPLRAVRKKIKNLLIYIALTIATVVIMFPIFWMIVTSLKHPRDFLAIPPVWLFEPTLSHYEDVSLARPFVNKYMVNSLIIAVGTTVITILLSSAAAYSLARFKIKGKENIAYWVFSQRMIPPPAVALPFYILMKEFGLLDTHLGLMILHLTFNLPFAVWLLRGFYAEIPKELDEAAIIDGCSRLSAFLRIIFPLSAPALAVTAIFCIVFSWNEFLFALVCTARDAKTLPVAAQEFRGWHETEWGPVCAVSTLTVIPLMLIAIFLQRYIVRGLTLGAVKG